MSMYSMSSIILVVPKEVFTPFPSVVINTLLKTKSCVGSHLRF